MLIVNTNLFLAKGKTSKMVQYFQAKSGNWCEINTVPEWHPQSTNVVISLANTF